MKRRLWIWFSHWVSRPRITPVAMRIASRLDSFFMKLSGGRFYFSFVIPVLILHCVGHKTGRSREVPLLYVFYNDKYYVFGSHGALPTEPAWCVNLRKQPKVSWQVKRSIFEGHARELPDNAKERVWKKALEIYPGYARYKERLARPIAIFELDCG